MRPSKVPGDSGFFEKRNPGYSQFMRSRPPDLGRYLDLRIKTLATPPPRDKSIFSVQRPLGAYFSPKLARGPEEKEARRSPELRSVFSPKKAAHFAEVHAQARSPIRTKDCENLASLFMRKEQFVHLCSLKLPSPSSPIVQDPPELPPGVTLASVLRQTGSPHVPAHPRPGAPGHRKANKPADDFKLLYDFYTESFKFSAEELARGEPLPPLSWMHLSCVYWIPELYLKDHLSQLDLRALGSIERERFRKPCLICRSSRGAAIGCSYEDCGESFHTECARRARLHLEIRNSTHTKFLLYCPKHTPLLFKNTLHLQDKKRAEEIFKFFRCFKKFFKVRKLLPKEVRVREVGAALDESLLGADPDGRSHASGSLPPADRRPKKPARPVRPRREQLVRHLDYEQKLLLNGLKKELAANPQFTFRVALARNPETGGLQVREVSVPPSSVFTHKIPRADGVWRALAEKLDTTTKSVFKRFAKLLADLRALERAPPALPDPAVRPSASDQLSSIKSSPKKKGSVMFVNNEESRLTRLRQRPGPLRLSAALDGRAYDGWANQSASAAAGGSTRAASESRRRTRSSSTTCTSSA